MGPSDLSCRWMTVWYMERHWNDSSLPVLAVPCTHPAEARLTSSRSVVPGLATLQPASASDNGW